MVKGWASYLFVCRSESLTYHGIVIHTGQTERRPFLLLFCTMTNKCTIISQITTLLLHVSTLSCHPQGACNQIPCQVTQVFQMHLLLIQFRIKMLHTGFMQVLILQSLKSHYYKIFKTLKLSYLQLNKLKFCCYNSHDVSLCGGCIYRGEFRPRQNRQLPRAVDLKGRLLSCQSY